MKLEIIRPFRHEGILGTSRYLCSGQKIKSLKTLNKYIVDEDDKMFIEYNVDEIDHKLLRKMISLFPRYEALRMGSHRMLTDLEKFYSYNLTWRNKKAAENIKNLFEALKIYWLIKKHGDGK